jgi:predicted MFS family arabinose efflux permease
VTSASIPPDRATHATVTLLSTAAFFSGAALRVCDPLLPRLSNEFGVSSGAAGHVIISFSIAYGLMQLVFGPLGDRFGKARMMCIALFGCALGALACAAAPGFQSLVYLRILWGMSAAGVIPLAMAWIGDAVPYEHRQATLARFLVGTLSGMVAGQLIGGLFADSSPGWRGAFSALALGYVVVGIMLGLHLRKQPPQQPVADSATSVAGMAARIGQVLGTPWARVVLLAVAAEGIFMLGTLAFVPSYLHERHGISLSAAAALAALYAVGGLAYSMTARRIVQELGERRMVQCGVLLMAAGLAGWWLLPHWAWAGLAALVVGFGAYLFHATLQTHATQMAPTMRGTAVSLFAFCLFAGQAVGVTLSGAVVDRMGYVPLLLASAVGLVAAGWGFAKALQARKSA